jgi:hypothetical protein
LVRGPPKRPGTEATGHPTRRPPPVARRGDSVEINLTLCPEPKNTYGSADKGVFPYHGTHDPHGRRRSLWAWAFNIGLWYVVTYLWLVLLSPALLRLFRRWPLPTLAVATLLPVVFLSGSLHLGYFVATYLSCWMIGFAHHDGLLRRVPAGRYAAVAGGLVVVGRLWLLHAAQTDRAFDLNHTPGANTLWSMAFVAVALRFPTRGAAGFTASGRSPAWYAWSTPALSRSTSGTCPPGCS